MQKFKLKQTVYVEGLKARVVNYFPEDDTYMLQWLTGPNKGYHEPVRASRIT